MQLRKTFKREERLKSKRVITQVFASGKSFLVHPFKVNWQIRKEHGRYPARVLISVSKKNFRKASERNQVKRVIREAYRQNKYLLYDFLKEQDIQCDFAIIYIARDHDSYSLIEKKIITLLNRLISELELQLHNNNPSS